MLAAAVRRMSETMEVVVIDLSPGSLTRTPVYHLTRIWRHLVAALLLIRAQKSDNVVYVGIPGGLGQLYLLGLAPLIRRASVSLFVRHDNYSYITSPTLRARMLFGVFGKSAIHITLCERMTSGLRAAYSTVDHVIEISNSWALTVQGEMDRAGDPQDSLPIQLTHMSNLSVDKGISRVIDAFRDLATYLNVRLDLAGPFADAKSRDLVASARREFGSLVRYWGPVSGEQKARLLAGSDVFTFPSDYVNEAGPLVVDEALAAGALVVCSTAGCLAELAMLSPIVQIVAPTDQVGLARALATAVAFCQTDRALARRRARALFLDRQTRASAGMDRLVKLMSLVGRP